MRAAYQFLQRFDLLLLDCQYRSLFFELCLLLFDQFLLLLDLRLLFLDGFDHHWRQPDVVDPFRLLRILVGQIEFRRLPSRPLAPRVPKLRSTQSGVVSHNAGVTSRNCRTSSQAT